VKRTKVPLLAALAGAIIGARLVKIDWSRIDIAFLAPDRSLLGHRAFLLAGIAAWALFGLYWEAASKNSAPAKRSESSGSRAVHVFLVNVALIAELAPIHGFGRLLPVSPLVMGIGLAIEFAGLLFAVWARRHLGRNWSGEITIKEDHQLIRTGPYRRLRHPIYTGLLGMYLGLLLVTGEWLAVIGFAVVVFAYWRKIQLEEANMNAAFGAEYEAYRRSTWALAPGLY
jgi:protein-S-isoprenylcysteine O-methyltransferase Ste14